MNRRTRNAAVMGLAAAAAIGLSGCQAGRTAQMTQAYDPVDGRNVNIPADASYGDTYVGIRNVVVVAIASDASLVATIVNNTAESQELSSITLGGAPLELSEPIQLEPRESAGLGFGDHPTATTAELDAQVGDWVDLTMSFSNAGSVELQVLVVPYGDQYEPITQTP
jgi:hypothetical protein